MEKLQLNPRARHLLVQYHQNGLLYKSKQQLREITVLNLQLAKQTESIKKIINQLYSLELITQDPKLKNRLKMMRDEACEVVFSDDHWDFFLRSFTQIHPAFFEKIKSKCGKPTPDTLRFCALMKLGINNQKIAFILGVSVKSLKVKRNRLKNQLKLEGSECLQSFINSL
ncbi:MAG TPA: hypothetical protein DCS93_26400 [Microscillaceae bacterium]|nr:hypothetical protein [Microscillaceae bacterium]